MTGHMNVTRDVTGGVTVPRPDPTRPITTSGHPSIDLTVGVEAPPEAWMDTSDLDLLDDPARHCRCTNCNPAEVKPLETFTAICGRRVLSPNGEGPDVPTGACVDFLRLYRLPCVKCGL